MLLINNKVMHVIHITFYLIPLCEKTVKKNGKLNQVSIVFYSTLFSPSLNNNYKNYIEGGTVYRPQWYRMMMPKFPGKINDRVIMDKFVYFLGRPSLYLYLCTHQPFLYKCKCKIHTYWHTFILGKSSQEPNILKAKRGDESQATYILTLNK